VSNKLVVSWLFGSHFMDSFYGPEFGCLSPVSEEVSRVSSQLSSKSGMFSDHFAYVVPRGHDLIDPRLIDPNSNLQSRPLDHHLRIDDGSSERP
jgi:hypothetical protein